MLRTRVVLVHQPMSRTLVKAADNQRLQLSQVLVILYLSSCLDLTNKIVNAHVRDTHKKSFRLRRPSEQPGFCLLEGLTTPSLNHVGKQSPWCPREADERDFAIKGLARSCDRLEDIPELFVHIDILTQLCYVRRLVERLGKGWTRIHQDFHAHSLWNNENIREDNCSVEQATVSSNWLHCDLRCEFGCPADLKEFMLRAQRTKLCLLMRSNARERRDTYRVGSDLPGASPKLARALSLRLCVEGLSKSVSRHMNHAPRAARNKRSFFNVGSASDIVRFWYRERGWGGFCSLASRKERNEELEIATVCRRY